MKQMEILAPVGGQQQLIAAVRSGADAVYLGAKGFNARRNAQNFDEAGLDEAVSYCHGRGVKVHVTLNTLVTDGEMEALVEEIKNIAQSGADAVIVQDLAVAKLIRTHVPTLSLHASTQMAIHNLSGAKALEDLGFSRIVLARELTLKEIEAIVNGTKLEVETFVHGALCMSVSGQCYLSSMLGGRSGNRGLCAQPCRLNYRHRQREYALSLKDMSYITHMAELQKAGVVSLKIEGRMKRPEYVAAAVTACKDALSGKSPDLDTLKAVFSRGGFTDGYLLGKRDLAMFGRRTQEDADASMQVLGQLASLYRREYSHIGVDMDLTVAEGSPVILTATDGVYTATALGEEPQNALNRPMDLGYAQRSLEKTGGTPFTLGSLTGSIQNGLMVPSSQLNTLRKDVLEQLLTLRSTVTPHPFVGEAAFASNERSKTEPAIHIRLERADQLTDALKGAERITLPIHELLKAPQLIDELGSSLIGELPHLIFPLEEDGIKRDLQKLKDLGLQSVCVHNIGALHLAKGLGFTVHGGHGLNVLNSTALKEYEDLGIASAILSFENAMTDVAKYRHTVPTGILCYGHLPLMYLRSCPAKTQKGCSGCSGRPTLTDRTGMEVPLLCQNKRYSILLNPIPLHLGHVDLKGMDFITLYFTTETGAEAEKAYLDHVSHRRFEGERTGGLYYRNLQ